MQIIKQKAQIIDLNAVTPLDILRKIERAGRVCYKSEDKITIESCVNFVEMLIRRGHESVLEHHNVSMLFITDRGVTHELVRHRAGCSYSQESTRYCNYGDKDIQFILPVQFYGMVEKTAKYQVWEDACLHSEAFYKDMISHGATPQEARTVLNNSLKTEIYVTMNLRAWRHFLKLRMAKSAHPQIRDLAKQAYDCLIEGLYPVFRDLEV